MNFLPFPNLKTKRLNLRQISIDDVNEIYQLRTDDRVIKYIKQSEDNLFSKKDDALKFINFLTNNVAENKSLTWGIIYENSPVIVGTICLWNFSEDRKTAEVGYDLLPQFQNQGIMNEGLNEIIHYGFEKLQLDLIIAFTHNKNLASKKLLEKNGFVRTTKRIDLENLNNDIFELKKEEIG